MPDSVTNCKDGCSGWKQIVWLAFCETDERYLDLTRVGYALALAVFFVLSILNYGEFSPTDWAIGISTILFGGGAGIGLRSLMEDGRPMQYHPQDPQTPYRNPHPYNRTPSRRDRGW